MDTTFIGTVTDALYVDAMKEQRLKKNLNLLQMKKMYWDVRRPEESDLFVAHQISNYRKGRFYNEKYYGSDLE